MTTIFWHQITSNARLRSQDLMRTLAFSAQAPWNQNLRRSQSRWCGRGWVCLKSAAVSRPTWTNNVADYFCTPWGCGLCVPRRFAARYSQFVRELRISKVLDRHGQSLFCGGDDLFSWLSVGSDTGFGIFPELRITHLIPARRVQPDYLVRLVHGHSFSLAVLRYMVYGTNPRPATVLQPPPHNRSWAEEWMVLHALQLGGVTWKD